MNEKVHAMFEIKNRYVHYGSNKFERDRWDPIMNKRCWTKPLGGLWASRKDGLFGWKDLCAQEGIIFEDSESFEFVMKDEHNIATIRTMEDLKRLPRIGYSEPLYPFCQIFIDFEKCTMSGIDAIELRWYGESASKHYFDVGHALYGWDCDSIIVLNPDAIIQIEK